MLHGGVSVYVAAKPYRLLCSILGTAVDEDKILAGNPCRVGAAGTQRAPRALLISHLNDLAGLTHRSSDHYRVEVPSHRANDRITGLILGRSGRRSPGIPRACPWFPALCGDTVGSTMGSTVDRDLQSRRERFEPFDDPGRRATTARLSPYAVSLRALILSV